MANNVLSDRILWITWQVIYSIGVWSMPTASWKGIAKGEKTDASVTSSPFNLHFLGIFADVFISSNVTEIFKHLDPQVHKELHDLVVVSNSSLQLIVKLVAFSVVFSYLSKQKAALMFKKGSFINLTISCQYKQKTFDYFYTYLPRMS